MKKAQQQPNQKMLDVMIQRCQKDPKFKQQLKENPKEFLKQNGISLKKDVQIQVIEERENSLTLVISPSPIQAKSLSDEELLSLSAGHCGDTHMSTIPLCGDTGNTICRYL